MATLGIMDKPDSDWMTPGQVAAEFQMATKTLANQRSRKQGFPYVRLPGGHVRYSRRAIAEYLAKRTVA
jgi:hypothetical protein